MKLQFVINKRRRSLISCTECRRRKQKCDEAKPSCTRCLTNNAICNYAKPSKPKLEKLRRKRQIEGTHVFSSFNGSARDDVANEGETAAFSVFEFLDASEKEKEPGEIYELIAENFDNKERQEEVTDIVKNCPTLFSSSSLELDLEYEALTIIASSAYMKDYFNKYNQCYSLILPLAYSNKTVMFTFAGWLLSINQLSYGDKFLNESSRLFDATEKKLLKNSSDSTDELTGVVVSQTCHALLASSRGDYISWRRMFERIYKLLDQLGIDEAINLFQNNPFACWVLGWFFYQDIFKLGKISNREIFGPLFSKNTYKKIIEMTAYNSIENLDLPSGCGPMTKCCVELFIIMGEVNTLYDLFTVKFVELKRFSGAYIDPIIESKSLSEHDLMYFLDSSIYKKYHGMEKHFHSWFSMKVGVLEAKLCQTNPNMNIPGLTDKQKANLGLFHDILKDSLRVFLKVKTLGYSIASFQIKVLCGQIIDGVQRLASWELNNYLLFPFLIAGTSVCDTVDKLRLQKLHHELKAYLKSGNLDKVWEMIQHVWNSYDVRDGEDSFGDVMSVIDCDVCVF